MKRRITAIMLSLAIALTFMPAIAFADQETAGEVQADRTAVTEQQTDGTPAAGTSEDENVSASYSQDIDNIYIGGKRVRITGDNANYTDVLNDGGSVKYDPDTNTITLTNATIEIAKREKIDETLEFGIRYNVDTPKSYLQTTLTIKLNGDNKIVDNVHESGTTEKYGIIVFDKVNNIKFSGSGTLSVSEAADKESVGYHGIETRKHTTIDGTKISIDMPGSSGAIGYDMVYSNSLYLVNGAELSIYTGSNANSYSFKHNSQYNAKILSVEEGSVLEAVSENQAFTSVHLKDATAALGALINTIPSDEGCSKWEGETDLNSASYKYVRIPYDHPHRWDDGVVTTAPTASKEGVRTYTCKICGATKTEEIPKLVVVDAFVAKAVAKGKRSVKLSWIGTDGADRYVIYMAKCGNKLRKVKVVKASKLSYTKKSLRRHSKYKFRVAAQKMVDGKYRTIAKTPVVHVATGNSSGRYTNARSVKVEPGSMTMNAGSTASVKASIKKMKGGKKLLSHTKKLRFKSSNTAVAVVDKNGEVTAVSKGTCAVYVQAVNGVWNTVTVTVK